MITGESPMHRLRGNRTQGCFFTRAVKDTRGVAAVEFGFMIPLFSLMLVSVTDIGLSVYRKMQVGAAAQAGAQYAMVRDFDASAISTAVTSATNATAVTANPSPTKFCGCATGSSLMMFGGRDAVTGIEVVAPVHDAIMAECPADQAEELNRT
jgi:Flp pilus assembly protein TadG